MQQESSRSKPDGIQTFFVRVRFRFPAEFFSSRNSKTPVVRPPLRLASSSERIPFSFLLPIEMPQESENSNPELPQQHQETDDNQKEGDVAGANKEQPVNDSQPTVQEGACILKQMSEAETCSLNRSPKSPAAEATEDFLLNEKGAYDHIEPQAALDIAPRTPANSETSEGAHASSGEELQESTSTPQVVEISVYSETVVVETEPETTLNGHPVDETEVASPQPSPEPAPTTPLIDLRTNGFIESEPEPAEAVPLINGQSNGEAVTQLNGKALNETVAGELIAENYKLPDVVEVKKQFEYVQPIGQNIGHAPPKKGALSTTLDSQGVSQAYQDVRFDGSETQWAVFKFQGPTIITSATGSDFSQFKNHFGDDERAFGYIRVQTGDEMSRRAKFLLVTWVGPSVSVLKRAKMSTDKALIKGIVSNFAVELQTENISDINLQNFEAELDKAAGAHYGTGIRS